MILSDAQIVAVAAAAGFSNTGQYDHALTWAVAICLAESEGALDATNYNSDGSVDRGLWQINSVHAGYDAVRLLTDAAYNASAAWDVSGHGRSFTPWVTFNTGAAAAYYNRAAQAVAGQKNAGPIPVGGDVTPGMHVPSGGGTLFYQTVVWTHEHPTVVITSGVQRSQFH